MPDKPETTVVSEDVIYEGRIVTLKRVEIQMPGGPLVRREIVVHGGSVGILPITDDGQFIFVRQFRPPAGQALLELPAGSVEKDEDIVECAQRELSEEIGQRAAEMRRVAGFYLAPGWATEFMHGFIATGLSPHVSQGDEDEDIELVTMSPEESLAAIRDGRIVDCKSVALIGLYFAERYAPLGGSSPR
ncbi:MAG: NUDIX hydrolase [Chloroflexi bacterium]|nr:NUDIX hydrolase [Chloroflexota bacterium]